MLIAQGVLKDTTLRVLLVEHFRFVTTYRQLHKSCRASALKQEQIDLSKSYTVKLSMPLMGMGSTDGSVCGYKIFSRKKRKTAFKLPKTFSEKIAWTRAFMEQADRDIEKINKLRKEG